MKLSALVSQYVAINRLWACDSTPKRDPEGSFCRTMGDIAVADMRPTVCTPSSQAQATSRAFWHLQIRGAPRFIVLAMHGDTMPVSLPKIIPKPPSLSPTSSRMKNFSDCSTPRLL